MGAIVNSYLPQVNTHLPRRGYFPGMAKGIGAKRGPKPRTRKKPSALPLVHGFNERMREAMGRDELIPTGGRPLNSVLAKRCGCSGAVIGQYLSGDKTTVDAVLLLRLCDALHVTPYYLALNEGTVRDIPRNKIPFEEFRKKKTTATTEEKLSEVDREATRGD